MNTKINVLQQKALSGDLSALEELRQRGVLSANKEKYSMAPVSYAQRRLWFIDKMEKTPAYNLSAGIILEGEMNTEALENAFREIIDRHEILRTVFVETDGIPYQKIFDTINFEIVKINLSKAIDKNERVSALLEEESNRCFDLSKGPLVVCSLIKMEKEKHLLLLNMHHIITDGWSIGVFVTELTLLYNSYCNGEMNPLTPLAMQYREYVNRNLQILNDEGSSGHKKYWREKLSGELPFSEIQPDFKRPLHKTYNGKLHAITIDKQLYAQMTNVCKRNSVSMFMFIVSAVNILISKYSGAKDILVGSPISGREQRDLENQMGFYVNTLPLRNAIDTSLTFTDILGQVKRTCIDAYEHQAYPFDLLIEDLCIERDTGRNPLFEIMVSLEETQLNDIKFNGIKASVLKSEINYSKFDLHFNFEESSDEMSLGIIYNPDVYTPKKIERLGMHFLKLVHDILSAPDEIISKKEIITQEERELLLNVFNTATTYYPKEKTIAELFELIVETYPDKPAIVYRGKLQTYRELNKKADSLAHDLINNYDVKLDEPVVLLMDRSHELIIAILGVLKAGGAYLPIDTKMPIERINGIIEDAKTRIILTDKKPDDTIYAVSHLICISDTYVFRSAVEFNRDVGKTSSNLAYILYTSGTTGVPKGSMIEEKSVIRLVKDTNYCKFDETEKMISTSSISFDATTFDLWGTLLNGGTLYLEDVEDYLDPVIFKSYIVKYGINKSFISTGLFVRLTECDLQYDLHLFEGLKEVYVGGDKMPPPASNGFIERYPEIKLVNVYGPTENTTFTTTFQITEQFQADIPIGKPITNTTVYIFNNDGNLCPVGVPGEIYIGGEGISRGYINRPELNKLKFVENPIRKEETVYRSGDIAQWCDDGTILFIGRNDDQVKIRGYRIETGEIENLSAGYDGITYTKIIVIQENEQKELALYYMAPENIDNELKKYLSRKFPEYMLPKYFFRLLEVPLNRNGKVDYKAFPKPDIKLSQSEKSIAPGNRTEKTIAKIFEEILNVKNIALTDNFFSLGGHSLKAIRAVSSLQKELSVKITLKEFFANPSVISLEEIIRDKKRETLGIIPVVNKSDHYDLSNAQKRLWVLNKIEKTKATYNIPIAITIYDKIDLNDLQKAFDRLIRRHESLRTIFIDSNGEPFQKIIDDQKISIVMLDVGGENDTDNKAFDYVVGEAHRPFILSEYPLIRFHVVKLSDEKYILFLNIHHIICDGWSLTIIIDELFGGYKNSRKMNINEPEPLKIQYKDYAYWLNESVKNPENDSDRTYWLKKLSGDITPLDIPADLRRPAVKTYQGDSIYFTFAAELKENLDSFNKEKRCSLFMTLTAAIKVLLYKYSGKEDILIGTPVAGRNHPDLENQVGYYSNTLVLRDQINPEQTFAGLLEEIKKTAMDAYSHQMYPFDTLVDDIKYQRDTSRSPLFDVMIVFQNFDISYEGVFKSVEPYKIPMNISKYDMTFNFNDNGEKLELLIEYNTKIYKQERIELIASHLFQLLHEVIINPVQIIKAINILSKNEEQTLLLSFNDTTAGYPIDKTIVSLFEETVVKYPRNKAVVYKDTTLTYTELNNSANSLAWYLLEKYAVSAGDLIGVFVAPSENTIMILLAILKAGGAYVPIDPEYPDERVKQILAESGSKVVITQSSRSNNLQKIIDEIKQDYHVLIIDALPEINNQKRSNLVGIDIHPDMTAYIIFTSGSTGIPKGCPISHRNLVRLFVNNKSPYDFNSSDVWILFFSYCFDFSVWEIFGALLFGGQLIIPDRNEVRDISTFVKLVHDHKITVLNQTPGGFYTFIDTVLESRNKKQFSLRYVIFGGDKLDPSKLSPWVKEYSTLKIKLINMYGITETTIHTTYHCFTDEEIMSSDGSSTIGKPLPETKIYLFDSYRMLVPIGIYGELYVAGTGVSKGYLNRPELTCERFIRNPYNRQEILYKSGDIVRWCFNGTLEYLDRSDNQVQVRGFRVEIAEVELMLRQYPGITDTVITAIDKEGTKELAAYIVSDEKLKITEIKSFLSSSLPDYMVPSYYVKIDKVPLTSNSKIDRKSLPPPIQNIATGALFENPTNRLETELLELWQEVLSTENISIHDNFFDLGGNSILLVKLHSKINEIYPDVMEVTDLFTKRIIAEQAEYIAHTMNVNPEEIRKTVERNSDKSPYHDVAVIGIAAKIGNCETPEEFWRDLCSGIDFIGTIPATRIADIRELGRQYAIDADSIKFREYCYLSEVDKFDYGFFKLSPNEASLIDPGQRLFMETAYHALEDAGYGGNKLWGSRTGIFIGASDTLSEYTKYIEASEIQDPNLLLTALTPSIMASRLAYHLNLKGPALLVDTACSSSLVAVHLACQSIREGKIDTAIVGGVKLRLLPIDTGVRLEIDASDSRAHSFDDAANGAGGGEGVIAILIKPLENALKDRDTIYAVIKGSEINQDGSSIGITAPNADAQADAIENAWLDAGIDPKTISYIETHGTATKLGDPVEIDGITKAFKKYTSDKNICAIGAVKANIGHLDTAAGIAGFLKAVLCLKYRRLTPLVHFKTPNGNIDFKESAAYINKDLSNWESNGNPLRCGLSAFGLSGTNCHVILEEAPSREKTVHQKDAKHLFTLSARSKDGLIEYIKKLKHSLYRHPGTDLENICYTLATGRGHYSHRCAVIFENEKELGQKLSKLIDAKLCTCETEGVFYNYHRIVASNKKQPETGEITENDIGKLSDAINETLKVNAAGFDKELSVAKAYVKGADVAWNEYYHNTIRQKVSLPGYPFEKNRCWVTIKSKDAVQKSYTTSYNKKFGNKFLCNCIVDTPAVAVYTNTYNDDNWLMNEHRVMRLPTLVGAAFVQIAYEAGKNHLNSTSLRFEDFYLLKPLQFDEGKDIEVLTTIHKSEENNLSIDIHSKADDNNRMTFTKLKVNTLQESPVALIAIEEIKKRMVNSYEIVPKDKKRTDDEIIEVSKKWNCLNKIFWNGKESLAELSVPQADMELAAEYYLYPPLLDAALSFAIDEAGFLPYSFGTVEIRRRLANKIYSYITDKTQGSSATRLFDITLADETGNCMAVFRDFTVKKISPQKADNCFHELRWKSWPLLNKSVLTDDKSIVVLYNSGCDKTLVKDLSSFNGITAIEIRGDNFTGIFDNYNSTLPIKILFLLPELSDDGIITEGAIEYRLEKTLYSAFKFVKYLAISISAKTDLLFVGKNVCEVSRKESFLNSLNNTVAGLGQVLQRENPNINCRFLDIDEYNVAVEIIDEIREGFTESFYYRAYRNGKRFIREISPVKLEEQTAGHITFKENGVYVITGGTGGIGLELAHYITLQSKIKLALINRSEFPLKETWDELLIEREDEKLCRKIDKLREIENNGAEVYFYSTDISDYDRLKTTIEKIQSDLGHICGVVHAAGVAGSGFIFDKPVETFRDVIKSKIHGTIYLSEILKENKPDFIIMTSALTALLPTSGQSDYTAANCFMDAYAFQLNKAGFHAVSINLTAWKETGMAFDYGVVDDGIFKSILTKNAVAAVDKIIRSQIASVILGEPDLSFLAADEGLPFYLAAKVPVNTKPSQIRKDEPQDTKRISVKGKENGRYTDFEIAIAQAWGTVLGYNEINVTDNYYDLGGDSIHVIKIVNLLTKQLQQQITISDVFNHLTVSELAAFLESRTGLKKTEYKEDAVSPVIHPAKRSDIYPVSSAQRRLFILDKLTKDKLSYHIPEIWNIQGTLEVDALIKAFKKIIDRHEILRTSFDLVQDAPVQIIHENVEFAIPVLTMNEPEAKNHIREFVQPFTLDSVPLFRTEIICISPDNHLVLFDAHHSIMDAFSMEILKKELYDYYEGRELAPLKIQYKDYAVWQSDYYKSKEVIEKKSYWKKQFEGEIPVVNLPLDYSRIADQDSEAGKYTFCIDDTLTGEIKNMSVRQGISPFMILLAAYTIVIHKYTQQDDIVIGVSTMGRENDELSGLLGMFVNNLPIRTYPRNDLNIIEYLNEVKNTVINAYENQDYPFDELIEDLAIVRDMHRSPLFDILFSYMNFEHSDINDGKMQLSDYRADITISSEYDLMLYGLEVHDKIYVTTKYKKALFKKESIERFAGHFIKTVAMVTKNKELKLCDIDILLPDEIERLKRFSNTPKTITLKTDVIDLLQASFTKNPESIGLLFEDQQMTYRELNNKANKLANYLQFECVVKPDELVGIMVERTTSMVVAMIGVIKSGAAYVGIDCAYPQKRIDFILADSKTKIIVTEKSIIDKGIVKAMSGVTIVTIDDATINNQRILEPVKRCTLENVAYIIYTSGSTGNPKGVVITHKNLSVFLHWCLEEFKTTVFDIVYASTSYCFDLSIFEIFYALAAGKSIRILKSALEIPVYLEKEKKVLINTVPSLVTEIKDALNLSGSDNVTALNLAGEQIPQALIDSIDLDKIEVRNLYGPSEDTTYSTMHKFSNKARDVLIGRPISNTQIYIVDRNCKLIPIGHPGEICIAGDGLAKGYLFNEKLTNSKFIRNPFGNGRLYRTGDLGRWTDDGDIEYVGRIDRQVKIRGFRIELGEIETNIRRFPSVENAVVIAYQESTDKNLAAYIVEKEAINTVDLKSYLGAIMPAYMIPSIFVKMKKIPLTPNGKIDVNALPIPDPDTLSLKVTDAELLNPTEELLSEIWKSVLGIDTLSKYDSFFNVGGHSLKALRLLSQINITFKCHCVLTDIFEFPTIAQLGRIITRQNSTVPVPILRLEKAEYYDVSHAQRRLWILDRVEKRSIAYIIPIVYHIKAPLDCNALQNAFTAIIQKYESFRTRFIEIDGEPKQAISDNVKLTIDKVEIKETHNLVADSKELIQKAITTPFNLEKAPLIRVTLIKHKTSEEYVVVVTAHHIILDEWSINILAKNLAGFYAHYSGKIKIVDEETFRPSPLQYKEYAYWHNSELKDTAEHANVHRQYWLELFRDPVQCLNVPSDYQRPKIQTFEGKTECFILPESLTDGLKKLSAENNATLFMTTLALCNVLFYKYTNQNDIVIGTPIANRDHPDIQDQIGFFLNTLALRNRLSGNESFTTFLDRVRNTTLNAFNHRLYPFDMLVDELQLPRDLSRSPLFDVMLISQTPAADGVELSPGLEMRSIDIEYPVSKYDLSISYCEDGATLKYFFEYNTALFRKERIVNMFCHFSSLIESVLSNEEKTLSHYNIISINEKENLNKLSTGSSKPLSNKSIAALIEKQADNFKNNLALVFKSTRMTFEEVNARANKLAHFLVESEGVVCGDYVCVMLDRSEWSIIAMLAILKAGGVYVPVDPTYPKARIRFILSDSNGKLCITSEKYGKNTTFPTSRIVTIDDIGEKILHCSVHNLGGRVDLGSNPAAYVIYTSGSTGEPKGVMGTHRCLLNLIEWQSGIIENGLKTLQYAPHSFDVSIQEMLFPLATAGTVYIIDNEMRYTMSRIAEYIEKEEIAILTMPYSALTLFLGEVENVNQLKSLKHIITSGEQPYINATIDKVLKAYPEILFHNQYGPSETHVVASYTVSGKNGDLPHKLPMGKPITNTQIFVLDKEREVVPTGIPGDVYIGGYNVALGYIHKTEMTRERFIDNPFGEGTLYKSGDVARWNNNGELEFLGRDDNQTKVRGYRIEPGEIESCLLKYPDIKETSVVVVDDGDTREIVAYFTVLADIDTVKLKEYMIDCLPAYMIPGHFVKLDSFPHTPSGKIDIRSLPKPNNNDNRFLSIYREPEGETEVVIAEVWKEILHREKISSTDNFFEIGGNSIRAIQIMSKIQKRLNKKTFLNLIFQHPTIKQMAAIIVGTDERLKNMGTDYILLNQKHEHIIFFLPPGIGYSFAYMEYAGYIVNYSVIGLNFIESADPVKSTVAILVNLQKEGEFYLFGHSAGGNMAYDVALELQKQGRVVAGIILLDSYRQLELIDWSPDEYLNDAVLYIEQNHAEFLDDEIKDAVLKKIVAYRKYLNARTEDAILNCPILQIEADGEPIKFNHKISRRAWGKLSARFEVCRGFGGHMDMLKPPNLEKNALLTEHLIDKLKNRNATAVSTLNK